MYPLKFYLNIFRFTADLLLANIDRVNNNNGGLRPSVSDVIYTTGSLDPSRVVSIVEDNIENSDVYVIAGDLNRFNNKTFCNFIICLLHIL